MALHDFKSAADWRNSSGYEQFTLAAQFVALAKEITIGRDNIAWGEIADRFAKAAHHGRAESFAKAAKGIVDLNTTWATSDGTVLSQAYLSEVAVNNLVDRVARFAYPMPPQFNRSAVIASGFTADVVAEGAPKVVSDVEITVAEAPAVKSAGILVISEELVRATGTAGNNLFRRLLLDAVLRASNQALLAQLPKISVSAGATAVDSLNAGLAAAADASGYVVAALPSVTRELAMASDGRMGVNGGQFIEGVEIVPVEAGGSGSPDMVVIPASRVALQDEGLVLRPARHATVDMDSNDPTTAASVVTPLWQRNLLGLLVERRIRVAGAEPAVEVG
jgi:hypothetical protein